MTSSPLLVAETIGKSYRGRSVLTSAYLHARPGSIVGLVGRNGTGKTTLLNIASGLLSADHGTLRFAGRLQRKPALHRLAAQGLFFLPADRSCLSPGFTVGEHLRGAANQACYPSDENEVTELLQLAGMLHTRTGTLSPGERCRTQLAIALLQSPDCLLADEPFRHLDPKDVELVMGCLRRAADQGCAVLISGHQVTFLLDLVDEVFWVTAGTTHLLGPPTQAAENWSFRREFLGV